MLTFLGNETVVDLYLYDTVYNDAKTEPVVLNTNRTDVDPNLKEINNVNNPRSSSYEHDYCTSEMGEQEKHKNDTQVGDAELKSKAVENESLEHIDLDHTYCMTSADNCKKSSHLEFYDDKLMYGLPYDEPPDSDKTIEEVICDFKLDFLNGNSLFKDISFNKLIPQLISKESGISVLKLVSKNGNTIVINKNNGLQQSLLKQGLVIDENCFQREVPTINYNKYKIHVPQNRFKTVMELLPFLFRRLPVISNLADDVSYKCSYPYIAKTLEEYLSWNIGKRLSSEVSI